MTTYGTLDKLSNEVKDFTTDEIAEIERIYQEKLLKYQAEIAQDNTGIFKSTCRKQAVSEVQARRTPPKPPEATPEPPVVPTSTPKEKKPNKATGEVIQLAFALPERTRPVSNVTVRAALFAAIQGKDRQLLNKVKLSAQEGIEIIFSGLQLNQDDHDVFMQLVFMASHKLLGEEVTVPANAILAGLGRQKGGKDHEQLKDEIHRLVTATVNIKYKGINFIGHLIDSAVQDEREAQHKRHWNYQLNPRIVALFGSTQFTIIDWEKRKQLKQKDLARWLHLYFASHVEPFPVSVGFLHDKSGSTTKELRKFRQNIKKALDVLVDIGFLKTWDIDKADLVRVVRVLSEAQLNNITEIENPITRQTLISPPSYRYERNLHGDTIETFRMLYPRHDPYICKGDFDEWIQQKKINTQSYDSHFLAFAKKWIVNKS